MTAIVSDATTPQFKIIHRYWRGDVACGIGEEILAVIFWVHETEFQLPLSLAERMVCDFLSRHRRVYLTTRQISDGIMADAFYLRHAANGHPAARRTRRFTRAVVKVYLVRIQRALDALFAECGAYWRASDVLTKRTIGNEAGWKLEASVTWEHLA